MPIDRRAFLKATGVTLGTLSIAGCAAPTQEAEEKGGETPAKTPAPSPTASPTPTKTSKAGGGKKTIDMVTKGSDYFFDPIGLFVEPGDIVTWRIKAGAHSTTAYKKGNGPAEVTRIPDGATTWDSGIMKSQGTTFTHTFDTTGAYDYFCIPHKALGMVGRIVVGQPGGPAEGSMPPDGKVPKSSTIVNQGSIPYSEFTG